jgi:hypothetical protein
VRWATMALTTPYTPTRASARASPAEGPECLEPAT